MMRVLAMLLVMVCALPAWADTDHRCLSNCMREGGASAVCMGKCTYTHAPSLPSVENAKPEPFAPLRRHGAIKSSDVAKKHVTPEKNYLCMSECLKQKTPYSFCEQRCAKK